KLLIHHYREEGKAVATAIIHEAFGMWPSPRNDQYPDKTTPLGIVAFFVGSPTVSRCCGKKNASRVYECSRSFMADGMAKDCAGLLLRGALEQQLKDVVVSYADPMQGHTGSLYKQCGFVYTGLSETFWEWQELAHPERNHQVVEKQIRAEKKAGKFDPTRYRRVPRMQKHRWVWFRPGCGLTSSDLQTWSIEPQLLPAWACCEHPDLAWHQKHQS